VKSNTRHVRNTRLHSGLRARWLPGRTHFLPVGASRLSSSNQFATKVISVTGCGAKGSKTLNAVILGHVMLHELGHLLLGVGSHGATGLMHVPWHRKELEQADQGALLFTPWEAETLRRNAAARLSATTVVQTAAR